jgi:predicted metalloprotease
MRLDDYRTSDNVEDQRGSGGGGMGFGGGGMGGGGLGLILSLVGSKFGIVGIIVVIGGAFLLGINPFGGGGTVGPAPQAVTNGKTAAQSCAIDAASKFSCQVMASTEDTWTRIFAEHGQKFAPAKLVFYSNRGSSGCGAAQSAMGPFYCPTDNRIYLDTEFFSELQNRFHAAGDFAQAYVVAHEMGHHIQTITGEADKIRAAQSRVSEAQGNALQVKMELQADCYAGVWAAQNKDRLEPGDIEEGMTAANAIGDDTLQKSAGQRPVPESFTHGTSAQRMQWLRTGLESGDPAQCDTFKGAL